MGEQSMLEGDLYELSFERVRVDVTQSTYS